MNENRFEDDPLESLLDDESSEEFGEPVLRDSLDPGAREHVDGNLANWSAADFASIHVRFRPHLERHARRYLQNPVQAEEVVQEAFLYLMTTLPEIDSELGVLKFLKWKIRLLCLDVIRSASNRQEVSVENYPEASSLDEEMSLGIERALDNALIRSALSQLSPRHREALVASVYEEKSSAQLASQMGLSENAARQLLFRARVSFKNALIGEAETNGKSVGEILSIAARKAALGAKKNAAALGSFVVLTAMLVGAVPLISNNGEQIIAEGTIESVAVDESALIAPAQEEEQPQTQAPEPVEAETNVELEAMSATDALKEPTAENISISAANTETNREVPRELKETGASLIAQSSIRPDGFNRILETNVSTAGLYQDSYSMLFSEAFQGTSVEVFGGTGISAFLDLDVLHRTVRQVIFQLSIDDEIYFGVARDVESVTKMDGYGHLITVSAESIYVVDRQQNVFSESPLAGATVSVSLRLAEDGNPLSATLSVR